MSDDHIGIKVNGVLYVKLEDARKLREGWDKADERIDEQATEISRLRARVAELERALKDAAASVGEWGAYASQYLQEKWDLPGEVARYVAIAEGKKE